MTETQLAPVAVHALPRQQATVNYVARQPVSPRVYYVEPPQGTPWTTLQIDARPVLVHDVRGAESQFSLPDHGVCFPERKLPFTDFDDDGAVRKTFYPMIEEFACDLLGARTAYAFGYAIRRREYGLGGAQRSDGTRRRIADFAHNDYTSATALDRARTVSPDGASAPFSIVNFWFPLRGPLYDHPLALCANGSVAAEDYEIIENVQAGGIGTMFGLTYAPHHQWFYKSGLAPGEFLVFRTWDSRLPPEQAVPHVAFADPSAPTDMAPRESFEVRVVLFDE